MSGLTYGSVSTLFRFMNVAAGCPSNFYRTQRVYERAIDRAYQESMTKQHADFQDGATLIIDTRFDTPGKQRNVDMYHCARSDQQCMV